MSPAAASSFRARRWDVLVLGGALPGLAAAIRLAMAGQRVLVVEEEAAARLPPLLREPFALPGPAAEGVLEPCLCALGLPLIERRAFETHPVAHQVILPGARIDVGEGRATAEEWVAWGLAKPDEATALVRGLEAAARAERDAMLGARLVRPGRRRSLPRLAATRPAAAGDLGGDRGASAPAGGREAPVGHPRGLPAAASQVGPLLARAFRAQVRAFSNLAAAEPSPEARARILGAPLAGGGCFHRQSLGLREILRRRLESLHAEFRTLAGPFEFVTLGDHPGIARIGPGDAWLGRALLVNAPPTRVADALATWGRDVPSFLGGARPTHRRLAVHLRALAEVVPEGLAPRAILVGDAPTTEEPAPGAIALSVHPSPRGSRFADLVARVVLRDAPESFDPAAERIEAAVANLMPFSDDRRARARLARTPVWDDEAALADPEPHSGWPGEVSLGASGRRPIYLLPREAVAELGTEGDLLLGWRAGDAMRQELC